MFTINFSGCEINNFTFAFDVWGFGMMRLTSVTGTGNGTILKLARGANAAITSNVTVAGTTEIDLDGTTYTFAALRALTPKMIVSSLGSSIQENP